VSRVRSLDAGAQARKRASHGWRALAAGLVVAALTAPGPAFAADASTVVDHRAVDAASDIALATEPGGPSVRLQATCDSPTTETVSASLAELVVGRSYRAALTHTSTAEPVPTVPAQLFVASASTATVRFEKVPGALDYTVTVVDLERSLEAQSRIVLTLCDLPMLESPPPPESGQSTRSTGQSQGSAGRALSSPGELLAVSVSGTTVVGVVGFGLLLLGLAVVGVEFVRRRVRRR
jgi:hypothetical protein